MGKGSYGICPSCLKYKYLNGKTCKTCTYSIGRCLICKKESTIYVDGLCYLCYQDRQVGFKIDEQIKKFVPKNDYNRQLFELYLSYIKRYRLQYYHVKTTNELIKVLQQEKIETIKGWHEIYILSDRYLVMQKPHKLQGCVFIKIGLMLSELGIIPPREKDIDHELQEKLSYFTTDNIKFFVNDLLKINTSKRTIIHILSDLKKLEKFMRDGFSIYSLYMTNHFHLLNFFDSQFELISSIQNRRKIYLNIKRFYSWGLLNRYLNINPMPDIKIGRPAGKLVICSSDQFLKLKNYITSPENNPEKAMLLTLILFFGFSTEQLTYSQLFIQNNKLCIKIRRKKLTKGKKYYCRKELLPLPTNPKWFLELQKRFYHNWAEHYQKVKKTFPNTPLVLPLSNISNRYLNTDTIRNRVMRATVEATGLKIPIRILKQTCGHLYTNKADASILSTLGWSDQFAFQYTWLPRTYFLEDSK